MYQIDYRCMLSSKVLNTVIDHINIGKKMLFLADIKSQYSSNYKQLDTCISTCLFNSYDRQMLDF